MESSSVENSSSAQPPLKRSKSGLSFRLPQHELQRSSSGRKKRAATIDGEREGNVQVVVRCRPFNDTELKGNVPLVVFCNDQRQQISIIQSQSESPSPVSTPTKHPSSERTFTFDKVFGLKSHQKQLYDEVVRPVIDDVMEGYNCTIFAYGQTGTGKTYTMEGTEKDSIHGTEDGEISDDAGMIPRAITQIFRTLDAQNAEYSVRVSFMELYNEEITDLLGLDEPIRQRSFSKKNPTPTTPILAKSRPKSDFTPKSKTSFALMEDSKGNVIVRGINEEVVTSLNDIYRLLRKGSSKRRTAETLLNKQSSRSHAIFMITTYINQGEGNDHPFVKCGKLNLVDLAGSENISRSGARDKTATEACSINKSLLTLRRVITALAENSGHVPYRDSKLTRLLKDSLGGKTKTCIIATVSPSINCLEETLSTLEYAHRAKNINNKPEVNRIVSKSGLVQDLYSEIETLKQKLVESETKAQEKDIEKHNQVSYWKALYEQQVEQNKKFAQNLVISQKLQDTISDMPGSPKTPRSRISLATILPVILDQLPVISLEEADAGEELYSDYMDDLPFSTPPQSPLSCTDDHENDDDDEEEETLAISDTMSKKRTLHHWKWDAENDVHCSHNNDNENDILTQAQSHISDEKLREVDKAAYEFIQGNPITKSQIINWDSKTMLGFFGRIADWGAKLIKL